MIETIVLVLHVLVAAGIIGLVLLQHGKGADMGAAFGSGASGTLFGASGSANFLSRSTAVLATVFFLSSVALTYFGMQRTGPQSVIRSTEPAPATKPGPVSDVPALPGSQPGAAPAAGAVPAAPAGAAAAPAGGAPASPESKAADVPK